uniref:Uncharacterized protein n=1 Tax=Arundo donax TaxID=35708 RepID=A0A0A8Z7Q5_ARUDO
MTSTLTIRSLVTIELTEEDLFIRTKHLIMPNPSTPTKTYIIALLDLFSMLHL